MERLALGAQAELPEDRIVQSQNSQNALPVAPDGDLEKSTNNASGVPSSLMIKRCAGKPCDRQVSLLQPSCEDGLPQ